MREHTATDIFVKINDLYVEYAWFLDDAVTGVNLTNDRREAFRFDDLEELNIVAKTINGKVIKVKEVEVTE